jgi:3-oxoacyl-[acyl-carrier protein] reductase
MDLGLQDRVVLVTGGSRGIGREIARLLVAEGAKVAICGRDGEASTRAAGELGAGTRGCRADVDDDPTVRELVADVVDHFGALDAVVNNAGRFGGGLVTDLTDAALIDGVGVKTLGAVRVVRHALPHLRRSDQARVVNISGLTAQRVTPGAAVSAVANSGVLTLTGYLAHELISDGILVNAVIPGYTLTGVWTDRAAALAEAEGISHEQALRLILTRQGMDHARWGRPEEIAAAVTFLLSARASFVNGTALRVDGGQLPVVSY